MAADKGLAFTSRVQLQGINLPMDMGDFLKCFEHVIQSAELGMQALLEDMLRLYNGNIPIGLIKMYILTSLKTSNLTHIIVTKMCALQIHGELYV